MVATATPLSPTMAKWNMRDCDWKIHSAAFARGLTVTIEVKWGYTQEMRGLQKISLSEHTNHETTHNMQATPGNKRGMWVLGRSVSKKNNETIQHIQYLGEDGEVGEVGEYFGEAGVINAGATSRGIGQSH